MGNPVYQTFSATGTGTPVFLDWTQPVFNASFAVDFSGAATGTFTVQYTLQDASNGTTSAVWHNDANVAASTNTFVGNYMFPVRAIQLIMSGLSASGTGTFSVLQGIPV
jgi:hypothetical protein